MSRFHLVFWSYFFRESSRSLHSMPQQCGRSFVLPPQRRPQRVAARLPQSVRASLLVYYLPIEILLDWKAAARTDAKRAQQVASTAQPYLPTVAERPASWRRQAMLFCGACARARCSSPVLSPSFLLPAAGRTEDAEITVVRHLRVLRTSASGPRRKKQCLAWFCSNDDVSECRRSFPTRNRAVAARPCGTMVDRVLACPRSLFSARLRKNRPCARTRVYSAASVASCLSPLSRLPANRPRSCSASSEGRRTQTPPAPRSLAALPLSFF